MESHEEHYPIYLDARNISMEYGVRIIWIKAVSVYKLRDIQDYGLINQTVIKHLKQDLSLKEYRNQ